MLFLPRWDSWYIGTLFSSNLCEMPFQECLFSMSQFALIPSIKWQKFRHSRLLNYSCFDCINQWNNYFHTTSTSIFFMALHQHQRSSCTNTCVSDTSQFALMLIPCYFHSFHVSHPYYEFKYSLLDFNEIYFRFCYKWSSVYVYVISCCIFYGYI